MPGIPRVPVDSWLQQAIAARSDRDSWSSISRGIGVHPDTVKTHVIKECQGDPADRKSTTRPATATQPAAQPQPQNMAAEVQQMQQAALRVTQAIESPKVDLRELWGQYETANAATIQRIQSKRDWHWDIPGNEPFAIAFPSDQHIALGPCDMRQMRIDAERIASTPRMAAVLCGDGVDNHIKHRAAVLSATDQPDMQWMLYEHYMEILRDSIAVVVSGNHDYWSKQFAGVDMVARLAAAQKVAYSPDEAYLTASLGGAEYVIGVRHQYRMNSSFNQTHSVKQWLRNGMRQFDIGVIGHHHEHAQETCWIQGRMRWFARPGSYQISTSYSAQYGYCDSKPTTPTVVIYPQERQIVGFDTCHHAARWLRAEGIS